MSASSGSVGPDSGGVCDRDDAGGGWTAAVARPSWVVTAPAGVGCVGGGGVGCVGIPAPRAAAALRGLRVHAATPTTQAIASPAARERLTSTACIYRGNTGRATPNCKRGCRRRAPAGPEGIEATTGRMRSGLRTLASAFATNRASFAKASPARRPCAHGSRRGDALRSRCLRPPSVAASPGKRRSCRRRPSRC
jgi:hypothetical protein